MSFACVPEPACRWGGPSSHWQVPLRPQFTHRVQQAPPPGGRDSWSFPAGGFWALGCHLPEGDGGPGNGRGCKVLATDVTLSFSGGTPAPPPMMSAPGSTVGFPRGLAHLGAPLLICTKPPWGGDTWGKLFLPPTPLPVTEERTARRTGETRRLSGKGAPGACLPHPPAELRPPGRLSQ